MHIYLGLQEMMAQYNLKIEDIETIKVETKALKEEKLKVLVDHQDIVKEIDRIMQQ